MGCGALQNHQTQSSTSTCNNKPPECGRVTLILALNLVLSKSCLLHFALAAQGMSPTARRDPINVLETEARPNRLISESSEGPCPMPFAAAGPADNNHNCPGEDGQKLHSYTESKLGKTAGAAHACHWLCCQLRARGGARTQESRGAKMAARARAGGSGARGAVGR